jgi:hypothetical protein
MRADGVQFARRHAGLGRVEHLLKNVGNDPSDALERHDVVLRFNGHAISCLDA